MSFFELTDLFLENEIDLALFTTLTDENLLSIGVSAFGARKIMTSAIKGNIWGNTSLQIDRCPVRLSNIGVLFASFRTDAMIRRNDAGQKSRM